MKVTTKLLCGIAACAVMAGGAAPALGQDAGQQGDTAQPASAPTDDGNGRPVVDVQSRPSAADATQEIVVTGIRGSISRALEIKRESINVVDSITSEDLGKLPDQNVAESLQRIPGVTIERNRGDGQFVSVRGLGPDFNAVTLNGRTLATDNVGRAFSFDVLPSELIAGADVYKSPTAAINGASIGATVNIRTIRPLDQNEHVVAASARADYSELRDAFSPNLSTLVSVRNEAGTFGVAISASYINRKTRDDEFTIGAGHVKRSSTDGGYFEGRLGPDVDDFTNVDTPSNLSPFFVVSDKERFGLSGTVQLKPTDNLLFTLDTLYTHLDQLDLYTGLAYDFSGGTLVDQVLEGNSAVYQKLEGGFVDEIIQRTPRKSDTFLIGLNTEWNKGPLDLAVDVSYSKASLNGRTGNYFTTIRRTGMTMWYDRRSGNPIYDYGFSSPDYADAPIDLEHIGAHYFIDGGDLRTDKTFEAKIDGSYEVSDALTLHAGVSRQTRDKDQDAYSQSFGGQCAFCGGTLYYPMPSGLFHATDMNFFSKYGGGNIVRDWVGYDPLELIRSLQDYRTADGESLYEFPHYDPAQSSLVTERVWLGYLMADWKTDIGGMPLAVNAGVRVEDTHFTSAGAAQTILSARPNGQGQNIIEVSDVVPIDFDGHYTDVLPSMNVRLDLTDNLLLRFAASKVMTRPTLDDLSPAQSIQTNPGNETIRRGNPDLLPFRAKQAEIGLEWYFQQLGVLSATAFYKDIDSFVSLQTTPQQVDQVIFQVTQPANGEGAKVKGVEVGYRQTFDFLPGAFSGLGAEASYTYVDSTANYANDVTGVRYGLEGLSPNSYTLVGFYEKGPVQARVAYTWRDRFLQVANGRNGDPEYFDAYGQLDASLTIALTDNLSLTANALNLTDSNEFIYSTTTDRTKEYRTTGRRYSLGVRARF
ncbi:TonB-dependent receptor [Stakelama saccharophila]|uniref:TonB-dependent receptor n=1 Tax=Stakelama saccharophila TaxID=3075605 RepID=A0ABZ0B673_9SPHN|nr:TonB-dependent receptor [Stakelama sp. W311]WNO52388.1 TonB-dependent receptor [Stakelama sp. W311]